jgi:hypothetical protein
MTPDNAFTELIQPLLAIAGVTRSTMMGLPCLRQDGTFFAALDRTTGAFAGQAPPGTGRRASGIPGRRALRIGRTAVPPMGRRASTTDRELGRVARRGPIVRQRIHQAGPEIVEPSSIPWRCGHHGSLPAERLPPAEVSAALPTRPPARAGPSD